jgi:predicted RNase H-like HicB family nuclease
MKRFTRTVKEGKLGYEIYVSDSINEGYTAYFLEFSKLVTQGKTIKEAQRRLWNAAYDILKNFFTNKDPLMKGQKIQPNWYYINGMWYHCINVDGKHYVNGVLNHDNNG